MLAQAVRHRRPDDEPTDFREDARRVLRLRVESLLKGDNSRRKVVRLWMLPESARGQKKARGDPQPEAPQRAQARRFGTDPVDV